VEHLGRPRQLHRPWVRRAAKPTTRTGAKPFSLMCSALHGKVLPGKPMVQFSSPLPGPTGGPPPAAKRVDSLALPTPPRNRPPSVVETGVPEATHVPEKANGAILQRRPRPFTPAVPAQVARASFGPVECVLSGYLTRGPDSGRPARGAPPRPAPGCWAVTRQRRFLEQVNLVGPGTGRR